MLLSQSINEQIQALEEATPEKRVELMNHIKEQLIIMNQEERMDTIHLLKTQLHNENEVKEETHQEFSQSHLDEEELHEHQLHQHHTTLEHTQEGIDEETEHLEHSHSEVER
jgi:hypothetical protein